MNSNLEYLNNIKDLTIYYQIIYDQIIATN